MNDQNLTPFRVHFYDFTIAAKGADVESPSNYADVYAKDPEDARKHALAAYPHAKISKVKAWREKV